MYFFEDSQVNPVTDYMVYSLVRQNTKETFWDVQEDSQASQGQSCRQLESNENVNGAKPVKSPPSTNSRVIEVQKSVTKSKSPGRRNEQQRTLLTG